MSHLRYLILLATLYAVVWIVLAIAPVDRADWMLENVLVLVFVALMAVTYRWLVFSRISYTLMFTFLCIHAIGAHYTYSLVPYDDWSIHLTGASLNETLGTQQLRPRCALLLWAPARIPHP